MASQGDAAPAPPPADAPVTLEAFQKLIERTYGQRDRDRGLASTYMWFAEEVGELARALRANDPKNLREEFADVLAWLSTLASIAGVDLEDASRRYIGGCPRCRSIPCACERGPARS